MNPRLLWGALALTLAATGWLASQSEDSDADVPAPRTARAAGRSGAAPVDPAARVVALQPTSAAWPAMARDLFAAHSFQPPPPPAPPPGAPEPPRAPPLPFKYQGRLEDGDTAVFLLDGTRSLIVRAGDTIDGRYKVERISKHDIAFTYLPLDQRQTLPTGRTH